jgi:hypothetical protein
MENTGWIWLWWTKVSCSDNVLGKREFERSCEGSVHDRRKSVALHECFDEMVDWKAVPNVNTQFRISHHIGTDSKFRVHIPFLTPLFCRYSIRVIKPGWGFCTVMALLSISRIFCMEDSCSSRGRLYIWSRMSVAFVILRADRISANI